MPRYHFKSEGADTASEDMGVELVDDEAARREAASRSAHELTRDDTLLWRERTWRMLVSDAKGRVLFAVEVLIAEGVDVLPRIVLP